MFHDIEEHILKRMQFLEKLDAADRTDGTPHMQRLRQIPHDTGRFLALLAVGAPEGTFVEIGTSAGYSTLWLALACREVGTTIITFEKMEEKIKMARETFKIAGVEETVRLIEGDARKHLNQLGNISFCFLDAEKDDYSEFYDIMVPKMVKGGILVADNVISHGEILRTMLDRVFNDDRMDALIVPIGRGELVCRKI